MKISWSEYGTLFVEQRGKTMITVNFYDLFHDHPITRLEKLTILQKIAEQALADPELTGERNDMNLGDK